LCTGFNLESKRRLFTRERHRYLIACQDGPNSCCSNCQKRHSVIVWLNLSVHLLKQECFRIALTICCTR